MTQYRAVVQHYCAGITKNFSSTNWYDWFCDKLLTILFMPHQISGMPSGDWKHFLGKAGLT